MAQISILASVPIGYIIGRGFRSQRVCGALIALLCVSAECTLSSLDIVFLIDGSGSVAGEDFRKMLTFVSTVMTSFSKADTQVTPSPCCNNQCDCRIEYDIIQCGKNTFYRRLIMLQ